MLKKFIFCFGFVFSLSAGAKNISHCPKHRLEAKTCLLSAFGIKVKVTESKISVFDGVWRQLEDFPYPGDDRQWDEVNLREFGKRKFLEIKLWDKPEGEAKIQSLLWVGYEIKDLKPVAKWKEVLQKRSLVKPVEDEAKSRPKGQFEEPKKPKYLYDKAEKYSLSIDKKGVLTWQVGPRKNSEKEN